MQFGSKETTILLDDNGSTKAIEVHYQDGKVVGKVREHFSYRHKITNDLEEYAQWNDFYKQYTSDPTILDPVFRIEGRANKNGKRFAVRCFSRIVE